MSPVRVKQHERRQFFRNCSIRASVTSFHRTKRDAHFKFCRKTDKGNNAQWKYINNWNIDVHKYLQIHDCIITTAPDKNHDINVWCKSSYLSKLICNQASHHTDSFLLQSFRQCAGEVDRSMPLETDIRPTVNSWSIWGRGTRCMIYTMNLYIPPVCISSFLLETAKHNMRGRINEHFSLTWLTFKCIFWWYKYNEVCN